MSEITPRIAPLDLGSVLARLGDRIKNQICILIRPYHADVERIVAPLLDTIAAVQCVSSELLAGARKRAEWERERD
jgi:hypothetical protein